MLMSSISNGFTGGIPSSSSPLFKVSLKHSEASLIKPSKTLGAYSLMALTTKINFCATPTNTQLTCLDGGFDLSKLHLGVQWDYGLDFHFFVHMGESTRQDHAESSRKFEHYKILSRVVIKSPLLLLGVVTYLWICLFKTGRTRNAPD